MFWIPNQLEGAYVGQDVTLECHSEAFPPSINYWEKEDGHTLVSGKLVAICKQSENDANSQCYTIFAVVNPWMHIC